MGLSALIALFLLVAIDAPPSSALEKVSVATPVQSIAELPVVVAMRNGYFRTEGLQIQKIVIEPKVAVRALLANEVDFSLAWDASLRAALEGAPIKVIAATAVKPMHVVVVRPEIRASKDLRGKVIGVDATSSTTDYLVRLAVRSIGVEPENHVSIVEIGGSAQRLAALKEGSIQATLFDAIMALKAESEGFKTLLRVGDVIDFPMLGVAAASAKLASQREQAGRFLRAILRGARFIRKYRVDAVEIIRSYLKIPPAHAGIVYEAAIGSFAEDGLVSDRVLALSIWRARDGLSNAAGAPFSQVADWSLLRELAAERSRIPFWLKPYDN